MNPVLRNQQVITVCRAECRRCHAEWRRTCRLWGGMVLDPFCRLDRAEYILSSTPHTIESGRQAFALPVGPFFCGVSGPFCPHETFDLPCNVSCKHQRLLGFWKRGARKRAPKARMGLFFTRLGMSRLRRVMS